MCIDNKIYLTFDMDWACDEVMDFLYDLLENYGLSATINITNYFCNIGRYRDNKRINLGIHPNFNPIINGDAGGDNKEVVIRKCKELIPDAVVARSHSLLNSTPLTKVLYEFGIKYELNSFIVPPKGMCVYPWYLEGVMQIPFFFEDDIYLMEGFSNQPKFYLCNRIKMYKIFNFHPIHLFLNTETLERYYKIKKDYHNFNVLKKNRNTKDYGILDFFKELMKEASDGGYEFDLIRNIRKEDYSENCGDR